MSSNAIITANNLSKTYRLYKTPFQRLLNLLKPSLENYTKVEALKGVSFAINKGEKVALIGNNGSGKSTLLQIISSVLYQTSGSINTSGTIAPLLELGAGFNVEYTGLENLHMNAAILGMSKKDIESKLDEIIKFSELGDAINYPVKTYSSGMFLRLAFSIAISTKPDILIADEILAVGDETFQKKCLKRIEELQKTGTTTLIVTHNLEYVKNNCEKALWLENGVLKKIGPVEEVCKAYRSNQIKTDEKEYPINNISCELANSQLMAGDYVELTFSYKLDKEIEFFYAGIGITNESGTFISGINSMEDNITLSNKHNEINKFKLKLSSSNMLNGRYFINLVFGDKSGSILSSDMKSLASFYIENKDYSEGAIFIPHTWN